MTATFKVPIQLQEKTGGTMLVEVRGGSVRDCIAELIHRHPGLEGMILDAEDNLLLKWMVYVNNSSAASSNDLSYQVKDGDIVALLPMVAGG